MIPYQETSEHLRKKDKETSDFVKKGVKTAANIGFSVATGTLLSRAIPLLNKYVPVDLAIKGLSKLDKRFGKFFKGMQDMGSSAEDSINFVREKLQTNKEESLSKFKEHQKKKGMKEELTDQFNQYYSPEAVENRLSQSQTALQPEAQQTQGQPQQQAGQGQQALMSILQKIQKQRGG